MNHIFRNHNFKILQKFNEHVNFDNHKLPLTKAKGFWILTQTKIISLINFLDNDRLDNSINFIIILIILILEKSYL